MAETNTGVVAKNDTTEVVSYRNYNGYQIVIHDKVVPDTVSRFAMELLRIHAGVTGRTDGEDSAGRSAMRRDTPQEAVKYACDLAAEAFMAFRERGWLLDLPGAEECREQAREEN